jgi:hypothetical protein
MNGTYDSWKATDRGTNEQRPQGCPVCTGEDSYEPCSEECDAIVRRCNNKRRIKALYRTARTALTYAHMYKGENYPTFHLTAIVEQVRAYRQTIKALRAA